jgi:hypothetical protein
MTPGFDPWTTGRRCEGHRGRATADAQFEALKLPPKSAHAARASTNSPQLAANRGIRCELGGNHPP